MTSAGRMRGAVLIGTIAGLALVFAVEVQPVYAQGFASLFNGTTLKGWKVEHTRAKVRDNLLHVGPGHGWVRTEESFADFALTLDIRLTGKGATGGVFVRAWPTFDRSSRPNNGHRLTLVAHHRGDDARQPPGSPTSPGPPPWRHLEIDCVGRTLVARLDGSRVYSSETVENPQGHIALWASSGAVEFRAIAIKEYPVSSWEGFSSDEAVQKAGEAGVTLPHVVREVKPDYTGAAIAAKITGRVLVMAVVLTDGTVREVHVSRSLDPKYGLDREAVAAVKRWRFVPGTRDGRPVSVLVSIELTFTLK
jgi:TonB family protein